MLIKVLNISTYWKKSIILREFSDKLKEGLVLTDLQRQDCVA